MIKLNTITKILGVSLVVLGTTQAIAEDATGTITLSVNNAIGFAAGNVLDFGELRATISDADATYALDAATATGVAGAGGAGDAIQQLGTPSSGTFDISGAAPFSTLDIIFPTTDTDIKSANSADPYFVINSGAWEISGTGTTDSGTAVNLKSVTLDGTGGMTFNVGAELSTVTGSNASFTDTTYTGSYSVTVSYQ